MRYRFDKEALAKRGIDLQIGFLDPDNVDVYLNLMWSQIDGTPLFNSEVLKELQGRTQCTDVEIENACEHATGALESALMGAVLASVADPDACCPDEPIAQPIGSKKHRS